MSGAATVTVVSEPVLALALPLPLALPLALELEEPELHAASPVASAVVARAIENQ
jgi:hypothetical protein